MTTIATRQQWIQGGWSAWALLVGVPLLYYDQATDPYSAIRWSVLSLFAAILCLTVWSSWAHWAAARDRWLLVAMALFSVMGALGMLVAVHPMEALFDTAHWLMVFGLMVALAHAMRTNPMLRRDVWRAGSVAALLLTTLRTLQYAGLLSELPKGGDPESAMLGNPNFFAGAMAMLAAFGMGAMLLERGLWRVIGATAALAAVVLVVMGRSSGATLALGVSFVVMLEAGIVLRWPHSAYASNRWLRLSLLLLALLAACGLLAWALQRPAPSPEIVLDSNAERILMWQKSLQMTAEHPALGVGAHHWHYHILRLGAVSGYMGFATRYYMEAHNDFLQQFAERGILGGLAFVTIIALLWRRAWQRVGRGTKDIAAMAGLGGLSAWVAFACTNLPAERPYLISIWVVLGAILMQDPISDTASAAPNEPSTARPWRYFGFFMAAACLVAACFGLRLRALQMDADRQNFKMMMAKEAQNWPMTEKLAKDAAVWYNLDDRVSATPIVWYQGHALLNQGNATAALPLLQAALQQHPWHPQVRSNLGAAYFMTKDIPHAEAEFESLLSDFPAFDDARMNLTEIYLTQGKYDQAGKTIQYWQVHDDNPRFNDYYAKVSQVIAAGKPQ